LKEKWIWTVRLIGIVVFLLLMYLLMSLHAQLVKMNEEQPKASKPVSFRFIESPALVSPEPGAPWGIRPA